MQGPKAATLRVLLPRRNPREREPSSRLDWCHVDDGFTLGDFLRSSPSVWPSYMS